MIILDKNIKLFYSIFGADSFIISELKITHTVSSLCEKIRKKHT